MSYRSISSSAWRNIPTVASGFNRNHMRSSSTVGLSFSSKLSTSIWLNPNTSANPRQSCSRSVVGLSLSCFGFSCHANRCLVETLRQQNGTRLWRIRPGLGLAISCHTQRHIFTNNSWKLRNCLQRDHNSHDATTTTFTCNNRKTTKHRCV